MQLIQIRLLPGLRKSARIAKLRAKDVAAGAIIGTLATGIALAPSAGNASELAPAASYPVHRQYPDCAQEDSTACLWDARHMGDGFGDSFVASVRVGHRHYYRHAIVHQLRLVEFWRKASKTRLYGVRIDDPNGGSFVVGDGDVVSVGDTTYVIRKSGRVGTS